MAAAAIQAAGSPALPALWLREPCKPTSPLRREPVSFRNYLQDHPRPLVWAWQATERVLGMLRGRFEKMGLERSTKAVGWLEEPVKRSLFDCQMCGQCVLHYTGMTCPMTCPKQIRNGPCGGVRADGHCEVYPDKDCVWVKAIERSALTPWEDEIHRLNPALDWRLEGEASWVTFATGRDQWASQEPPAAKPSKSN